MVVVTLAFHHAARRGENQRQDRLKVVLVGRPRWLVVGRADGVVLAVANPPKVLVEQFFAWPLNAMTSSEERMSAENESSRLAASRCH